MLKTILLIALGAVLFVILDLLWFQVAGNFFKAQVGSIARLNAEGGWDIRFGPAVLVYIMMSIGVFAFVLTQAKSVGGALTLGALFGLVGYGLYDLTNLATLTAWTVSFAAVDMAWGTVLCAVVSAAMHALSKLSFFS